MRWRFLLRLVLCIGSIAPAGCLSSHVACDCATESFLGFVGGARGRVGRHRRRLPVIHTAFHPLDGGQCDLFVITFTAAGNLPYRRNAADGRRPRSTRPSRTRSIGSAAAHLSGPRYQISLFPAIDGALQPVDAAVDAPGTGRRRPPDRRPAVPLPPDPTGWVDRTATGTTNIQGRWYGFADGFGADGTTASGACEMTGSKHPRTARISRAPVPAASRTRTAECAPRAWPRGSSTSWAARPPTTTTSRAPGLRSASTFADMTATPLPYNATANGVTGIAFDIDTIPLPGLRIQFPTAEQPCIPRSGAAST